MILAVAVAFGAALFAEARVLPRVRPAWFFRATVPLPAALAPLPGAPRGAGRTASVAWQTAPEGVRFWAEPGAHGAPFGLRGLVVATEGARGHALSVRFCPPIGLLGMPGVLFAAAVGQDDAAIAWPVALALGAFVPWWYGRAALRAAAEVRVALVETRG